MSSIRRSIIQTLKNNLIVWQLVWQDQRARISDIEDVVTATRSLAAQRAWLSGCVIVIAAISATTIFPVLEAITFEYYPEQPPYLTLAALVVPHVILAFLATLGTYRLVLMGGLIDTGAIEDALKILERSDRDHKSLIEREPAIQASLTCLSQFLVKPGDKEKKAEIALLLEPLVKRRTDVLGFKDGDALYNIAVYLYEPETATLELVWRDCDKRLTTRDRKWKSGVGHTGIAFARNEVIITPDAEKYPELLSLDDKDRDLKYYCSFMSIAINDPKSPDTVIGVLNITSSRKGQFDDRYHRPLCNIYRLILSIYFGARSPISLDDYRDRKG